MSHRTRLQKIRGQLQAIEAELRVIEGEVGSRNARPVIARSRAMIRGGGHMLSTVLQDHLHVDAAPIAAAGAAR